ncbi:glycoside hydrolase family 95 protein [Cohnella rhizosphaerae]|uniref:Glycoside hydrolase family 95 protein n=1 Tax=Cohnella rhizosphaerae TaxID=1457232 RepID=A0A9X4KT96_9BACL|nr:glycoside hydrolase family 95 protein [Cohnella rhizosphaerae]MDG0809821.1 glycoside hydrolase family 95 protein [Cohnella rhizosphaerae]
MESARETTDAHLLWSNHPAKEWAECYPIGNGRLGAMIPGSPEMERIGLNHDLLWREYWTYKSRDAAENLAEIRALCAKGKWDEASELMLQRVHLTGEGLYVNSYVPACDLGIRMFHRGDGEIESYRRSLDMEKGIAEIVYQAGGIEYRRTYFCDWKTGVVVVRLSSDRAGSLCGEVSLSRLLDPECVVTGQSKLGEVRLTGKFEEGKRFAAAVRVLQRGGRLTNGNREYRQPEGGRTFQEEREGDRVRLPGRGDDGDLGGKGSRVHLLASIPRTKWFLSSRSPRITSRMIR